jgi:hypothetical protein
MIIWTIVALVAATAVVGVIAFSSRSARATLRTKGVNVYLTDDCSLSASEWQTTATNAVDSVKSLGANAIALAFPFYMDSINANSVVMSDRCPSAADATAPPRNTVSPERLAVLVQKAHAAGLDVVLRPLLDEANLTKWRGVIEPTDESAWFASYGDQLRPYLRMAQTNKVEQFSVSGELNSLAASRYWPALIASVRRLYSGRLVFATTWPVGGTTAHPSGSIVGIDAYPRLASTKDSASASEVLAGWNDALRTESIPNGATLYEVGINANDGAYALPSAIAQGAFNEQVQANWFTAACEFVKTHKLGGIYFWGPDIRFNHGKLTPQPEPKAPFQLQPATQAAIRECF